MADISFLIGGGEMGERFRTFAGAGSPLGAAGQWLQPLKTLVAVMLAAEQPMFVAWGAERTLLYNDGYAPLLGRKHPQAFGLGFFEVWSEVRDELTPLFDRVFAGEPIHMDDIALMLDRGDGLKEAHFAFSYTPVRDEHGAIVGLFCPCNETTETVLANRRNLEQQRRLAQMFEQGPSFMALLQGPNHRIELANPAYLTLVGGRDVLGRDLAEALPEAVEQGYVDLLDQVYRSGQAFSSSGARYVVKADSSAPPTEWFVDFVFQPLRDAAGQVVGIFVEGVDVTQRTLVDAALRDSEARLRELNADLELQVIARSYHRGRTWQVSPDIMAVADSSGYFESSNPACATILGWSPEEFCRTPFLDLVHPDDRNRTSAVFEAIKQGEPALRFENRYRCKTGDYRWLSWVAVPEGDKVYATARDVTTEKAQTLELAERTAERDRVWRNSRDLLIVIGSDGVFRAVNPAWTAILGHDWREVVGRSFLEYVWPDDKIITQSGLESADAADDLTNFENRYKHQDGGFRWISWNTSSDGALVYAYGRDITAEKEAAAALAAAQEQLRQAQKMEAVGQLTGGLAHDFNNLLIGITGSLELLQSRLAQGRIDAVERYVTAAQGAARRAAALTQRLLAFSRRQTLDPKATDINRLIAGLEDLLRRTVGPSIIVEVVGAAGLWTTMVDPNQLENAVLNLCINARDAMPEGGRLTVETANKVLDERSGAERDLPPGQYVSICVTDTGTGMTAEVIQRAFDPFFTTKPLGEGTGLGLSMIYGFARQSGGQVRIYSELGKGSTLCIYLPRHFGEADKGDMFEPGFEALPGDGETVLVVDDEPTVRMLVCEVLAEAGYVSIEGVDGPSGLRILQSDARIDLLITDVGLPGGMNGRQMADAGRLARPGLKVLFITGYAENAAVGNGHLEAGMQVLTKPFPMEALARKLREMLEG